MAGKQDVPSASSRFSKEERKKEASRLAGFAQTAQDKASELTKAAAGAGDPQERQKLLNDALQKEIEAESFGKTAKWLSSGSFQGFLVGTGIGAMPGITLGTLTGTLVGGLTSMITGGLGGLIGAGVGAVHGPFIKAGDVVGHIMNKWLPTIPGWTATKEQKRALEKMLGQIQEQDQPTNEELDMLQKASSTVTDAGGKKDVSTLSQKAARTQVGGSQQPGRSAAAREHRASPSKQNGQTSNDPTGTKGKKSESQRKVDQPDTQTREEAGENRKKVPKKLEVRSSQK